MNDLEQYQLAQTRRTFLRNSGVGMGSLALASLLVPELLTRKTHAETGNLAYQGRVNPRHFEPKAKRVIFLCMAGGPSHLESFDYKSKLQKMDGQLIPESLTSGMPIAQLQGKELKCYAPQTKFQKHGQSGQEISDYFPHIATVADEIAIVRSMVTEQINHDPAHTFMNCGTAISGRPSMGSWALYGLGAETQDLPGFVVATSVGGRDPQPIAARQWSSGFLPSKFQGVEFFATGDPVHYVANPRGYDRQRQREVIDTIQGLNRLRLEAVDNPEIATRLAQYEMAFKMQSSVPELLDMSDEPQRILDLYGVKQPGDGSFASNCLLARRLAERGVRFIHLYHRGWDHHSGLKKYMSICSQLTDKPAAALIKDLRQRDMLDDTLIIWGGEFGRTPMAQGDGRDHHIKGFSMFLAGGGIKGGVTYGATDELGYNALEDVVHVRDLHATMLRVLGINHRRFAVRFQGLDLRLTGVEEAHVVKGILA
jgi:hypothetical protein